MNKDEIKMLKKNVEIILPWVLLTIVIVIASLIAINSFRANQTVTKNTKNKNNKEIEKKTEKNKVQDTNETTVISENKDIKNNEDKYIGKIKILINSLNLRDAPSKNSSVIGRVNKNEILFIISEENGWYKATNEKEINGYVTSSSKYVELIQE